MTRKVRPQPECPLHAGLISDAEVDDFIKFHQGFMIRERGYPRKPFQKNGRPRRFMAVAALNCRRLGIPPERYIGILFGRYCTRLGRREPSPRTLASREALEIVRERLQAPLEPHGNQQDLHENASGSRSSAAPSFFENYSQATSRRR
jgi:hypothetical protein